MKNKYLSKIIIGTWSLSGDLGYVSKKQVFQALDECLKYNFKEFDIAPTYGQGNFYKLFEDFHKNNPSLIVNTKCGYDFKFKKTFKEKDIIKSLNYSLKLFKKINILFLHNPRIDLKNAKNLLKILKNLKADKKIFKTGISLARDFYFNSKLLNGFDFIQDEINVLRLKGLIKLKNLRPKIIARSPFATGCLTGNLVNKKFNKIDYRISWLSDNQRKKNILKQINELKNISTKNIKIISKNFLLQNNSINKIIFGIKKKSHVKELYDDIKNFDMLSNQEINKIKKLYKSNYFSNLDEQLY